MKTIIALLLSLSITSIWSQFDLAWVKEFDVNSLPDLAIDSLGNSYTMLHYKPEEGVEYGASVAGETRTNDMATIVKTNPQGEIEWHLTIEASKGIPKNYDVRTWCRFRDISVSEDGERIALLVQYDIKIDREDRYNQKEVSSFFNRTDVRTKCFILCYSKSGKFLWKTDFNVITAWEADQHLDRVTFGPGNELYLVKSYATIDFKNKPLDPNDLYQHRIGLFRFSHKGKFIEELISWEQTSANHKDPETFHEIQQLVIEFDPNDNIYLHGLYRGNLVLSDDEVLSNYGTKFVGATGFLAKFSKDMEFKWRYRFAGTMGGATIRKIRFNAGGDLYFAGDFSTNIYISKGNDLVVQTKTPPTSHSGRSLFYGKLNARAELEFVKYHQQEKHYTDSGVSTMWLDELGRSHIVGFYNDSLTISGCEKTLFPGMRVDTSRFTYEGKILTSYHPRYFYGLYHAVYQDDSILSLDDVFDFEKPVWPGGFFSRPIIADNSVYFTTSINEPVNAFLKNEKELKVNPGSKRIACMVKMPLDTPDLIVDEMAVVDDSLIVMEPDSLFAEWVAELKDSISVEFIDGINDTIIASTEPDTTEQVFSSTVIEDTLITSINVFPNPFQRNINVVITNPSSQFELKLYNGLGQLVFSQLHRSSNVEYRLEMDLSPLAAGTYYLSMEHENYRKVIPVIKSDP